MSEETEPRIIQIMPADDWYAQWPDQARSDADPLIGWALVERATGERYVTGLYPTAGGDVTIVGWYEGTPDDESPTYHRGNG